MRPGARTVISGAAPKRAANVVAMVCAFTEEAGYFDLEAQSFAFFPSVPYPNYFCGVKNAIRFLGITILVLFCCFVGKPPAPVPESSPVSGMSGEAVGFSKITKTSLFHTAPNERYGENQNGGTCTGAKTPFNSFWAVLWATERRYTSVFAHYVSISSAFQIRNRKADLIFPFHYFW